MGGGIKNVAIGWGMWDSGIFQQNRDNPDEIGMVEKPDFAKVMVSRSDCNCLKYTIGNTGEP